MCLIAPPLKAKGSITLLSRGLYAQDEFLTDGDCDHLLWIHAWVHGTHGVQGGTADHVHLQEDQVVVEYLLGHDMDGIDRVLCVGS